MSVEVRNVSKTYIVNGGASVAALDNICLAIGTGEFLSILGPSGCGKSTLLRLLAGLESADEGTILVDSVPVSGPDPDRGLIFQDHALFPWRTVEGNVSFGLEVRGCSTAERRRAVDECLELVGLAEFRDAYPCQLSGGMKQRTALARSLVMRPSILLMDESFGSLDAQTRSRMQEELIHLWEMCDITVVFVTHDVEEAVLLGDRVAIMASVPGRVSEVVPIEIDRRERRGLLTSLKEDILERLGMSRTDRCELRLDEPVTARGAVAAADRWGRTKAVATSRML